MRTTVTFDGHDLTAECVVSDLRRPLLPRELGAVTVPGMDGELPTGQTLAPFDLGLTLTVMGRDPALREVVRQKVAADLNSAGEAPLAISEDNGLWYKARPTATSDGSRSVNAESFDVTFRVSDPVRYGRLRTVTVPKDGSATFHVGGTHPTMPTVTTTVASGAEGQQWTLTLEDGTYLLYQPTYTGALHSESLVIDCEDRTLTAGNLTKMLAPTADWLILAPGEHTLTMGGEATGGAATVTFYERWV